MLDYFLPQPFLAAVPSFQFDNIPFGNKGGISLDRFALSIVTYTDHCELVKHNIYTHGMMWTQQSTRSSLIGAWQIEFE